MFAHQVIEDLKKYNFKNIKLDSNVPNNFHLSLIDPIKKSHKFHFGEIKHIRSVSGSLIAKPLFQNSTYLKLPYDFCWFDYINNTKIDYDGTEIFNTKEAVLIINHKNNGNDIFEIYIFSYFKTISLWLLMPGMATLQTGIKGKNTTISGIKGLSHNHLKALKNDFLLNLEMVEHSLKLLNCKNIITEKIIAPKILNKKRRKSGRVDLFDYHVLNIIVPSNKKTSNKKTEPLSHNRVHLCRGHFKEYTIEKPLFGKLTGLYWWQPHVRGQNKKGIVLKDYVVNLKGE